MCKLSNLFRKKAPVGMPSMSRQEIIERLEYDILIHEYWAVEVTEHPEEAEKMGDYDWHMHWIEVYENALFYLRGGKL